MKGITQMNKSTIDMALEAGFTEGELAFMGDNFGRFADLVRKDELEACAKVCDVLAIHPEYASDITKLAAAAIRARGETK
jgi:hypothetical protein